MDYSFESEFYNTVYSHPECDKCMRPSKHKTLDGGERCIIHMRDYRVKRLKPYWDGIKERPLLKGKNSMKVSKY